MKSPFLLRRSLTVTVNNAPDGAVAGPGRASRRLAPAGSRRECNAAQAQTPARTNAPTHSSRDRIRERATRAIVEACRAVRNPSRLYLAHFRFASALVFFR